MSSEKLSSEEVPKKFTEWLLKMGCPADKVPSLEKVTQMCRGQYYMVWRSLIEHVHPKDTIQQKRLNVFCDDIKTCQQKKAYGNHNVNVVVPEQLEIWNQQVELEKKVGDAENRVQECQKSVKELTEKASVKLIQHNTSRRNIDDVQRRIWLLRKVGDGLIKKKKDLEEVKKMSKSMCLDNPIGDIQNHLEECLTLVNKGLNSSSEEPLQDRITRTELQLNQLSPCGGSLWPLLLEKRVAAAAQLKAANDSYVAETSHRTCPYYVIALTSSLQSMLGLEVLKNQEHIKQTQNKILALLDEMNHTLSSESCEYLVLQCEIAHMKARMQTLKTIAEDIVQHRGSFSTERFELEDPAVTINKIRNLDNAIMSKREELCNVIKGLATIENKVYHIRDCIQIVLNAFKNHGSSEFILCRGIKLDLPEEPIRSLCQFYQERRARVESKANLSMDLDVSDASCNGDPTEYTFVDELKLYLKKFNLEKNRKLVLDSGEKIWTFETVESSLSRIQSYWPDNNLPILLAPYVGISTNLQYLIDKVLEREAIKRFVKKMSSDEKNIINIDIKSIMDEEAKITDSVKKSNRDNINSLQKINKTLDLIAFNLQYWASNEAKKCISRNRTVDGKGYKEYEALYLENIIGTAGVVERMERSL
ncbi:uncharacterized protein LOC121732898 isoform X2 [Aricia agestis]|uniref:uncharacterized protein LOC121732898 isoform X2 n=1 Tax=Aricia agestis TaxID=91739 RepID=UPI001C203755|nr:uncharacterized protein LOC121732898 isoform X2 [Aricia agestis]